MRTASDIAVNVWESLPDFDREDAESGIDMIADALTAFRNDGIEEAAKEAALHCVSHRDYETGTDNMIPCELPERIRALKK